jgi:2-hydroxycyclohexanecarboxyl-CoA dehydrogenase
VTSQSTGGHESIAVVTGAASGIGRATAEGLGRDGHIVALADLNHDRAEEVAELIVKDGGRAHAFAVDVGDTASVRSFCDEVLSVLGPPSVLVNCAGWDEIQPFAETTPEFWSRVLDINLRGVIAVTHGFLDALISTQGRIVNVASDAGRVGSSGETVYAGAKAGIIGFTKSVAREVAKHQVPVNCVCPGPIATPFLDKNPPKLREALARAIPMRRIGEPDDVWHAIRYFAGPGASYVTGQVLSVSGGLTMNG